MTLPYCYRRTVEGSIVDLVEDYGVRYPIDVFALARQMGVSVVLYEDLPTPLRVRLESVFPDAFTVTGAIGEAPCVFLKEMASPYSRVVFTLGHELGHIWLNHRDGDAFEESEADYFSGYLLAPHPFIILRDMTVSMIAQTFGVGGWSAEIALAQAKDRISFGPPYWEEHELRLLRLASMGTLGFPKPP